jgi:deoxyribodipyrimidine photolyase-related protein
VRQVDQTIGRAGRVRLLLSNQLFEQHLRAVDGTCFVLVEHDLLVSQHPFHAHALVLRRAALTAFGERLRDKGFRVETVLARPDRSTDEQLLALLERLRPDHLAWYEPVDDWIERDLLAVAARVGVVPQVLPTPAFCTTTAQVHDQLGGRRPRMQHFYEFQRRRLDLLMDGDRPAGGRWSFDTENRRKLPRDVAVPEVSLPAPDRHVRDAVAWVRTEHPDAPGDPGTFAWPTTHAQARTWLEEFVQHRLRDFGPYEDAISAGQPWLFHSAVSPALNLGLLDPLEVVRAALDHADSVVGTVEEVPLSGLEGFVRQVVGWREYMRGVYVVHGRRLRTRNLLGLDRPLPQGFWDGTTGLAPVDLVVGRVLERGWCHHIERLMVLGNAMLLLRVDPDEVYRWFSAMFVDAYDWVMVPNVYAMSQFAGGELVTTKPYVSGSNYLRKMSDLPPGEWREDWDALFWTFVRDHLDGFARNPRSSMMARTYEGFAPARKAALSRRAAPWLEVGPAA